MIRIDARPGRGTVRTLVLVGVIALTAEPANAQRTQVRLGPLGLSAPAGFHGDRSGVGNVAEIAVSRGISPQWSLGLTTRLAEKKLGDEGTAALWLFGIEARRILGDAVLTAGHAGGDGAARRPWMRFLGIRGGLATWTGPEAFDAGDYHEDFGVEFGPVAGVQYWFLGWLGSELTLAVPVGWVEGAWGIAPTLQLSVVVGW